MQTYTVEAAKADLPALLDIAAKGEEVLLTKNNRPLAKLVPIDEAKAWRRDIRKLRGFVKGIPPFEREDDDRV